MNETDTRISIEMTGKNDANAPWNIALAGFAGAGKTLFGSTAPKGLFLFFAENPRIKSIRERYVPHVKLTNEVNRDGVLVMTVQDKLQVLVDYLHMNKQFETLVVDTGDELFQAMKAGRRIKQGGEFSIGDWSWIGDAYREVVTGLIDLPLNVLVLYHVKNTSDGEDGLMRELMLQGLPKDEAPSWFDVVGTIDTYEVVNEEGDNETRRTILTQPTRVYPWLKDHSGNIPRRFDISRDFVGDFDRFIGLLHGEDIGVTPEQEHQVIAEITVPAGEKKSKQSVPTPTQLQEKKAEHAKKLVDTIKEVAAQQNAEKADKEVDNAAKPAKKTVDVDTSVHSEPEEAKPSPEGDIQQEESKTETLENTGDSEDQDAEGLRLNDKPELSSENEAAAEALVEDELGGTPVLNVCAECGELVEDADLRALTEIRFRKILCRPHFKQALEATRR